MNPVLDASVFVAAVSPSERHHSRAVALLESHPSDEPYLVPALFRVEVVAGLARRGESAELLDIVDALVRGPRFHACPLDADLLAGAVAVARRAHLRAYDAVYLALAMIAGSPLYTLDAELSERAEAAFPEVEVRTGS